MAKHPNRNIRRTAHQSGVAAIEFALIAALMAFMLLGIFVYWRVLQAQQSVTRATGDGARMVQNLIYGTLPGYNISKQTDIRNIELAAADVVIKSLLNSGIPGDPKTSTSVALTTSTSQAQLNISYQLPPLFGNAPGTPQTIQFSDWTLTEPLRLQANAVVSFALSTGKTP
ncbi:MAG: TadE/TadG family type IV pilus assembly protein [Comamonas sp.]